MTASLIWLRPDDLDVKIGRKGLEGIVHSQKAKSHYANDMVFGKTQVLVTNLIVKSPVSGCSSSNKGEIFFIFFIWNYRLPLLSKQIDTDNLLVILFIWFRAIKARHCMIIYNLWQLITYIWTSTNNYICLFITRPCDIHTCIRAWHTYITYSTYKHTYSTYIHHILFRTLFLSTVKMLSREILSQNSLLEYKHCFIKKIH